MFRTSIKIIGTVLAAAAVAVPVASAGGPRTPSEGNSLGVLPEYQQKSEPTTPRISEGFSFKAPSYWNAGPGYWSTVERMVAPITPRVAVNRSLGVPPQYLASSEQASTASNGFDWLDAGVGAAFIAGLGALGLGAFVAVRRRHGPAQLEV